MSRVWIERTLFVLALVLAAGSVNAVWAAAPNSQAVFQRVRPLAQQGNANAQYNLGVIYDRGYGVERDYDKARYWYEKAAAQGYAKAAHNLGVMYQQGHGVPQNDARAAYWFEKAARLGEPAAANNLAVMYARGEGVEKSMRKAALWAARAAQAGNASAVANLSLITADLPRATIAENNVNIRGEAGTDAVVLKQADAGTQVVLLQQHDGWSHILFTSDYVLGWVANFLLKADAQGPGEDTARAVTSAEQAMGRARTTTAAAQQDVAATAEAGVALATQESAVVHKAIGADVVNIRKRPTTQSPVLFQVHQGDRVTIVKGRNGWKYVRFDDGRSGWVAGFLLIDA